MPYSVLSMMEAETTTRNKYCEPLIWAPCRIEIENTCILAPLCLVWFKLIYFCSILKQDLTAYLNDSQVCFLIQLDIKNDMVLIKKQNVFTLQNYFTTCKAVIYSRAVYFKCDQYFYLWKKNDVKIVGVFLIRVFQIDNLKDSVFIKDFV